VSSHTLNIFKAVKTILEASKANPSGTLHYIKNIYEGWRNREDIGTFPVIIIEPNHEPEGRHTIPNMIRSVFEITIVPFMEVYNPNNQITGDNGAKGIMDLTTDIKNVLSVDKSLAGTALKLEFPTCDYYFENFPYRYAELSLQVEYISQDTQR